jgi:hypothetical protein
VLTGLGGGGGVGGGGSLGAAVAMLGLRGNFLATAGPRGVIRFNQIDRNRWAIRNLSEIAVWLAVGFAGRAYSRAFDRLQRFVLTYCI